MLAGRVADRVAPVALPFVAWLVVVLALGFVTRPEGDVILPGGSLQWVAFAMIIGGTLAGTITVVMIVPPRAAPLPRAPLADEPRPLRAPSADLPRQPVNGSRFASRRASCTALTAAGGMSVSTSSACGKRASSRCRSATETWLSSSATAVRPGGTAVRSSSMVASRMPVSRSLA